MYLSSHDLDLSVIVRCQRLVTLVFQLPDPRLDVALIQPDYLVVLLHLDAKRLA